MNHPPVPVHLPAPRPEPGAPPQPRQRLAAAAAAVAAAGALHDLDDALQLGSDRLMITLDPSHPGACAVLEALRAAVGTDRVRTRAAGASVLVDVELDGVHQGLDRDVA